MEESLIVYCDGGSRGNPGPAASAFVVTQNGQVIHKEGKFLGIETNNVAEYNAVLMGLTWILKNKKQNEIIFNLDSQLVERQLNGVYKIKNQNLKIYFDQIKKLILENDLIVKFQWGYRSSNKLADTLVNEELDRNRKLISS